MGFVPDYVADAARPKAPAAPSGMLGGMAAKISGMAAKVASAANGAKISSAGKSLWDEAGGGDGATFGSASEAGSGIDWGGGGGGDLWSTAAAGGFGGGGGGGPAPMQSTADTYTMF